MQQNELGMKEQNKMLRVALLLSVILIAYAEGFLQDCNELFPKTALKWNPPEADIHQNGKWCPKNQSEEAYFEADITFNDNAAKEFVVFAIDVESDSSLNQATQLFQLQCKRVHQQDYVNYKEFVLESFKYTTVTYYPLNPTLQSQFCRFVTVTTNGCLSFGIKGCYADSPTITKKTAFPLTTSLFYGHRAFGTKTNGTEARPQILVIPQDTIFTTDADAHHLPYFEFQAKENITVMGIATYHETNSLLKRYYILYGQTMANLSTHKTTFGEVIYYTSKDGLNQRYEIVPSIRGYIFRLHVVEVAFEQEDLAVEIELLGHTDREADHWIPFINQNPSKPKKILYDSSGALHLNLSVTAGKFTKYYGRESIKSRTFGPSCLSDPSLCDHGLSASVRLQNPRKANPGWTGKIDTSKVATFSYSNCYQPNSQGELLVHQDLRFSVEGISIPSHAVVKNAELNLMAISCVTKSVSLTLSLYFSHYITINPCDLKDYYLFEATIFDAQCQPQKDLKLTFHNFLQSVIESVSNQPERTFLVGIKGASGIRVNFKKTFLTLDFSYTGCPSPQVLTPNGIIFGSSTVNSNLTNIFDSSTPYWEGSCFSPKAVSTMFSFAEKSIVTNIAVQTPKETDIYMERLYLRDDYYLQYFNGYNYIMKDVTRSGTVTMFTLPRMVATKTLQINALLSKNCNIIKGKVQVLGCPISKSVSPDMTPIYSIGKVDIDRSTDGRGFIIAHYNQSLVAAVRTSDTFWYTFHPFSLPQQDIYEVAFTWEVSHGLTLFLNGKIVSQDSQGEKVNRNAPIASARYLNILGTHLTPHNRLLAFVLNIRIWKRELSYNEMADKHQRELVDLSETPQTNSQWSYTNPCLHNEDICQDHTFNLTTSPNQRIFKHLSHSIYYTKSERCTNSLDTEIFCDELDGVLTSAHFSIFVRKEPFSLTAMHLNGKFFLSENLKVYIYLVKATNAPYQFVLNCMQQDANKLSLRKPILWRLEAKNSGKLSQSPNIQGLVLPTVDQIKAGFRLVFSFHIKRDNPVCTHQPITLSIDQNLGLRLTVMETLSSPGLSLTVGGKYQADRLLPLSIVKSKYRCLSFWLIKRTFPSFPLGVAIKMAYDTKEMMAFWKNTSHRWELVHIPLEDVKVPRIKIYIWFTIPLKHKFQGILVVDDVTLHTEKCNYSDPAIAPNANTSPEHFKLWSLPYPVFFLPLQTSTNSYGTWNMTLRQKIWGSQQFNEFLNTFLYAISNSNTPHFMKYSGEPGTAGIRDEWTIHLSFNLRTDPTHRYSFLYAIGNCSLTCFEVYILPKDHILLKIAKGNFSVQEEVSASIHKSQWRSLALIYKQGILQVFINQKVYLEKAYNDLVIYSDVVKFGSYPGENLRIEARLFCFQVYPVALDEKYFNFLVYCPSLLPPFRLCAEGERLEYSNFPFYSCIDGTVKETYAEALSYFPFDGNLEDAVYREPACKHVGKDQTSFVPGVINKAARYANTNMTTICIPKPTCFEEPLACWSKITTSFFIQVNSKHVLFETPLMQSNLFSLTLISIQDNNAVVKITYVLARKCSTKFILELDRWIHVYLNDDGNSFVVRLDDSLIQTKSYQCFAEPFVEVTENIHIALGGYNIDFRLDEWGLWLQGNSTVPPEPTYNSIISGNESKVSIGVALEVVNLPCNGISSLANALTTVTYALGECETLKFSYPYIGPKFNSVSCQGNGNKKIMILGSLMYAQFPERSRWELIKATREEFRAGPFLVNFNIQGDMIGIPGGKLTILGVNITSNSTKINAEYDGEDKMLRELIFSLTCHPKNREGNISDEVTLALKKKKYQYNTTIDLHTELPYYHLCKLKVFPISYLGVGMATKYNYDTPQGAPSRTPGQLVVTASAQRQLDVTVGDMPVKYTHGQLLGFNVSYCPTDELPDAMFTKCNYLLIDTSNDGFHKSSFSTSIYGLETFKNYTIRVAAFTVEGTGPFAVVYTRTLPAAPVKNSGIFSTKQINATCHELKIKELEDDTAIWKSFPPWHYDIKITSCTYGGFVYSTQLPFGQDRILVPHLTPFQKYDITIGAINSNKVGNYSYSCIQTKESVPIGSPKHLQIIHKTPTNITVLVGDLKESQMNGIIKYYNFSVQEKGHTLVKYHKVDLGKDLSMWNRSLQSFDKPCHCNRSDPVFKAPLQNFTIEGLKYFTWYSIASSACTSIGCAKNRTAVEVETDEYIPVCAVEGIRWDSPSSTQIRILWNKMNRTCLNGILQNFTLEIILEDRLWLKHSKNLKNVQKSSGNLTEQSNPGSTVVLPTVQSPITGSLLPTLNNLSMLTTPELKVIQDVPTTPPMDILDLDSVATPPAMDVFNTDSMPTTPPMNILDTVNVLTTPNLVLRRRKRSLSEGSLPEEKLDPPKPNFNLTNNFLSDNIKVPGSSVPIGALPDVFSQLHNKVNTTHTEVTISELLKNSNYSVRVRAATFKGAGPWSEWSAVKTKGDIPSQEPYNVTAFTVNGVSVGTRWHEPHVLHHNSPILGYLVYYKKTNTQDSQQVVNCQGSTCRSKIIAGLNSLTSYSISVAAYNIFGTGVRSNPVIANSSLAIDGGFTTWTEWTACSRSCGGGSSVRRRSCTNPSPFNGGKLCQNETEQYRICNVRACSGPLLGVPGDSCEASCKYLKLMCQTNFHDVSMSYLFNSLNISCNIIKSERNWMKPYYPSFNLLTQACDGYEQKPISFSCQAKPPDPSYSRLCICLSKEDAGYTPWTQWGICSKPCGEGRAPRLRTCLINSCKGQNRDERLCNPHPCPVDGAWGEWKPWTKCNSTCGMGARFKFRYCDNPAPQHGGKNCTGTNFDVEVGCNPSPCPIHGNWGPWGPYLECTTPCGGGYHIRKRKCDNPKPQYGGRYCQGSGRTEIPCNPKPCKGTKVTYEIRFTNETWHYTLHYKGSPDSFNLFKKIKDRIKLAYNNTKNIAFIRNEGFRSGSVISELSIYYEELKSNEIALFLYQLNGEKSLVEMPTAEAQFTLGRNVSLTIEKLDWTLATASSAHINWTVSNYSMMEKLVGFYVHYFRTVDIGTNQEWMTLAVKPNMTEADLVDLWFSSTYVVFVVPGTPDGTERPSSPLRISTKEGPPTIPLTDLESENTDTQIFLRWKHDIHREKNGKLLGYKIRFRLHNIYNFNEIRIPISLNQKTISPVKPFSWYWIEVFAYTGAGNGPISAHMTKTKEGVPSVPPANVAVESYLSTDTILIRWGTIPHDHTNGKLRGYVLKYRATESGGRQALLTAWTTLSFDEYTFSTTLKTLKPYTTYQMQVCGYTSAGEGEFSNTLEGRTCRCAKDLYSSWYAVSPYVQLKNETLQGIIYDVVKTAVIKGCYKCKDYERVKLHFYESKDGSNPNKESQHNLISTLDATVDLSFPVFGRLEQPNFMDTATFLPVARSAGSVLITRDETKYSSQATVLFVSILNIWPIVLVTVLSAWLVGIIVWFTDQFENPTEFSIGDSLRGPLSGLWWAFITMTTVGYGDITPRGYLTRTVAMVWFLTGLVITSILTGAISTTLTSSFFSHTVSIYGHKVGTIQNSYEYNFAVRRNGIVNEARPYNSTAELLNALISQEVDMVLLDTVMVSAYQKFIDDKHLLISKKFESTAGYGVVLNGDLRSIRDDVASYISSQSGRIMYFMSTIHNSVVLSDIKGHQFQLFDGESPAFYTVLSGELYALLAFICMGLIIHIYRKKGRKTQVGVTPDAKILKMTHLDSLVKKFGSMCQRKAMVLDQKHLSEKFELIRLKKSYLRLVKLGRKEAMAISPNSFKYIPRNDTEQEEKQRQN